MRSGIRKQRPLWIRASLLRCLAGFSSIITQGEKHGIIYRCIVFYTTRNLGRWFTIVFYSEYDRIRTIYTIKTAEIRWQYGRKTPARFTVEYGINTAVYGQISVEYGRLLWRYSGLRRPVIFLLGMIKRILLITAPAEFFSDRERSPPCTVYFRHFVWLCCHFCHSEWNCLFRELKSKGLGRARSSQKCISVLSLGPET